MTGAAPVSSIPAIRAWPSPSSFPDRVRRPSGWDARFGPPNRPRARVFEEVDEALGEALSRVIFEGPDERLRLTENAQPALMATSLAALRTLEARSGRPLAELCDCVAGHSLGEYSALAAAGSLRVADAARLLRVRGRAMQAAVPVGEGAMAAILGLELAAVEEVAAAASAVGVCDVANDNAPGQVVVSGARAAVERAVELAKGRGARRSMLLAVSAPFHCRLLAPAAEAVRAALAGIALRPPAVPLIGNVTRGARDRACPPRGAPGRAGHGARALAREPADHGRERRAGDRRARRRPRAVGPDPPHAAGCRRERARHARGDRRLARRRVAKLTASQAEERLR